MVRLAIITVCKRVDDDLLRTASSVMAQSVRPALYLIKSANRAQSFAANFGTTDWVEVLDSPDVGIYDAMNISVRRAVQQRASHLMFLNAGDLFCGQNSLEHALSSLSLSSDVCFFPWIRSTLGGRYCLPSARPLRFNHQATIYRSELHLRFGPYPSAPGFTTADYFFFGLVIASGEATFSLNTCNALCVVDITGVSSNAITRVQVAAVDYLLGSSPHDILWQLCIFPARRLLVWARKFLIARSQ